MEDIEARLLAHRHVLKALLAKSRQAGAVEELLQLADAAEQAEEGAAALMKMSLYRAELMAMAPASTRRGGWMSRFAGRR